MLILLVFSWYFFWHVLCSHIVESIRTAKVLNGFEWAMFQLYVYNSATKCSVMWVTIMNHPGNGPYQLSMEMTGGWLIIVIPTLAKIRMNSL